MYIKCAQYEHLNYKHLIYLSRASSFNVQLYIHLLGHLFIDHLSRSRFVNMNEFAIMQLELAINVCWCAEQQDQTGPALFQAT